MNPEHIFTKDVEWYWLAIHLLETYKGYSYDQARKVLTDQRVY